MGKRNISLACVTCLDIYAQNPTELTSQLVFSQLLWMLLRIEACSFRHSCVCSQGPQTDVILMLVLEFLCSEQLVLYEASVLLSDPLQQCFLHHSWMSGQALYTPWNLNYRVVAEAGWDCLRSGRTWPFSSFTSAYREEDIWSMNYHESLH